MIRKMPFPPNGLFPVLPTGHISDCPKLPDRLEIDGRDVSAGELSFPSMRSFISATRLSVVRYLTMLVSTHTRPLHWNTRGSDTRLLLSLRVVSRGQLFGRMMRTSGEFDPIVVSAIQKLRCEWPNLSTSMRCSSYPSKGEPAFYLFGLATGMNCSNVTLIGLSDLSRLLIRGGVYDNSSLAALGRYRIIALTNNFGGVCSSDATKKVVPLSRPPGFSLEEEMRFLGWEQGVAPPSLRNLFDDFCDSSVLGMRQVCSTTVIESKP
jgi:hypothetical protein